MTRDSLEEPPPSLSGPKQMLKLETVLGSSDCRRNLTHLYLLRPLTPLTSASVEFTGRSRSGQKGIFFIHLVVVYFGGFH